MDFPTTGPQMRPTFRLVPDFIVPHLNKSTYGNHLHWEDRRNGSFKISRIHQSSEMWNEQCIEVYKAWSIKKKLWKLDDPKKITKAKHRLITALRRNPEIEMLEKESSFYRFRIVHQNISEDGRSSHENPSNENNGHNMLRKNDDEISKNSDYVDVSENCDTKKILEISKENRDASHFSNSDAILSSTYYPFSQPEFYENTPKIFPMSDLFNEELYPDETKSAGFSDKCCCDVLLDNYLCNQKCIWHGMPP